MLCQQQNIIEKVVHKGSSITDNMNSTGTSVEPCGTPPVIDILSHLTPLA